MPSVSAAPTSPAEPAAPAPVLLTGTSIPRATSHPDPLIRALGWVAYVFGDRPGAGNGRVVATTAELKHLAEEEGATSFGANESAFGRRLVARLDDIRRAGLTLERGRRGGTRVWILAVSVMPWASETAPAGPATRTGTRPTALPPAVAGETPPRPDRRALAVAAILSALMSLALATAVVPAFW